MYHKYSNISFNIYNLSIIIFLFIIPNLLWSWIFNIQEFYNLYKLQGTLKLDLINYSGLTFGENYNKAFGKGTNYLYSTNLIIF